MTVAYQSDNVLVAAKKRVGLLFDEFDRIVVSVSGGKDSTVIRALALAEAERRGRRIELFFLDQEAEYESTIAVMRKWMADPAIIPTWLQVPVRMTNATSHRQYWLNAWGPGETWVRPKEPNSIHELPGCPDRFYDVFEWYEQQAKVRTAFIVGLRSKESFNRFRSVTKNPGYKGLTWTTGTKNPLAVRAYPIYDWTFGDVWKFIVDEGLEYNHHYDRMFAKHGANITKMRVSCLIHEKSFHCLSDLQEFEPETYDRMTKRLAGVHCAALYAGDDYVFSTTKLPSNFKTWKEYRDYLLASTPIDKVESFVNRFNGQQTDESTCRQQVKQILVNDWENSLPVTQPKLAALRDRYWDVL
jgi:predicted phosphoadenosine phosphosulfate sulfurtransferase